METTSALIGNICMIPNESGIERNVEVQLEFCVIKRGPSLSGIASDGYEEWVLEVDLAESSSAMTTMALNPPQGAPSVVGIDFVVLMAGSVLKRKRRGYMSAVPCG